MRRLLAAFLVLGLTVPAAASFGEPAAPPAAPPAPPAYLSPSATPDTLKILPASPKAGDPQDRADHVVFAATRALQGTPRWNLARSDDHQDAAAMLADFSCAVGVAMTPASAPELVALLARTRTDEQRAVDRPKNVYMRASNSPRFGPEGRRPPPPPAPPKRP